MEDVLYETKSSTKSVIVHACLIFLGIGMFTIWKPLFAKLSTRLTVTNKRVSGKQGILKTQVMDSSIKQITSVKVEKGFWGNMFNYGKLHINTAGGNYSFNSIDNPDKVKNIILEQYDKYN